MIIVLNGDVEILNARLNDKLLTVHDTNLHWLSPL